MNILICSHQKSTNPYIGLLARAYTDLGHHVSFGAEAFWHQEDAPDIVHIHWPEALYNWSLVLPKSDETLRSLRARLGFFRQSGSVLVYTVHNDAPHESEHRTFEQSFYSAIWEHADVRAHHGPASLPEKNESADSTIDVIVEHGAYEPRLASSVDFRDRLHIPREAPVAILLGRQRAYKGAALALDVFSGLGAQGWYLVVAGALHQWISRLAPSELLRIGKTLVRMRGRYRELRHELSNDEVTALLNSVDLVFLGHEKGLNTGLLPLAISHGKPVVYPAIGNFLHQAGNWPLSASYPANNAESAGQAVRDLYHRQTKTTHTDLEAARNLWMEQHRWDQHAEQILTAARAQMR